MITRLGLIIADEGTSRRYEQKLNQWYTAARTQAVDPQCHVAQIRLE